MSLALTAGYVGLAQASPTRIPDLHSTTLAGQSVDLPLALQGKVGILVVGFSRESRVQAKIWGKRLAVDFEHSSDVSYFEMPVVEEVPRLLRGVVLRAIARDVSPAAQAHFLPIANDEARWKAVTHFAEPDSAYVLVVDGAGNVRWQTSGDPAAEERYAALRRVVSRTAGRPAPTP